MNLKCSIRFALAGALILVLLPAVVTSQSAKEYIRLGGRLIAVDVKVDTTGNAGITPSGLFPPTNLVATVTSTAGVLTGVLVEWMAPSNSNLVGRYEIERSFNNGPPSIETVPGDSTFFVDTPVAADVTYIYRVRAFDAFNFPTGYTNKDLATTVLFMDPSLEEGATKIKAAHIEQLRTAVNAVRVSAGTSAITNWVDSTLAGNTTVKAAHVAQLREYLGPARTAIGLSTAAYTDPSLDYPTTVIRKTHIEQLRQNVQ